MTDVQTDNKLVQNRKIGLEIKKGRSTVKFYFYLTGLTV